MYERVTHRSTFKGIADRLHDLFGLPVADADVCDWQSTMARYYEGTYRRLVEKIVAGNLIHADETQVRLKTGAKGYVWVFASLEEVVFMYRESREGGFLSDLLKGFRGVLVSDFYAAYDSIECEQQKCLIHLMRDFNEDLLKNPWDEELKALAAEFGALLRLMVATIDVYGLKRRHLGKHQRDVDRFFAVLDDKINRSDLAEAYRTRLFKYRSGLFTFLNHDGVPWNNNSAEHAIKRFAKYRYMADGRYSEAGLSQHLLLLSMCVTCKFRRINFLNFLLSGERDIDTFDRTRRKGRGVSLPIVELHPSGVQLRRPSRKQTWDRERLRNGGAP
jgi:hypothetical protein